MPGAFPCKDCVDRYLGCHSTCNKYLEASKKNNMIKEKIAKENRITTAKGDIILNFIKRRR